MDVIEIDGSLLEGGGQVLRNCTAYAALLHKRAHIVKIRANRSKPGLRPQALEGLKLLATLTNGTLVGAFENSQEILFTPGAAPSTSRSFSADARTAGSCALILQNCLAVLLFRTSPTELVIKGGTDVSNSPPMDHVKHVLLPLLAQHFRFIVELEIVKRGFVPRGGGIVRVNVHPSRSATLPPIRMLERGVVVQIVANLFGYGRVDSKFIELVRETVLTSLNGVDGVPDGALEFVCNVQGTETKTKLAPSCGLFLYAKTSTGCILGGSALGTSVLQKLATLEPQMLAALAVQDLLKQLAHGGCVDEHVQDQLIIFMALAEGVSEIVTGPITLHTETAIYFAQHMTEAKITVAPVAGSSRNVIRCQGMGCSSP